MIQVQHDEQGFWFQGYNAEMIPEYRRRQGIYSPGRKAWCFSSIPSTQELIDILQVTQIRHTISEEVKGAILRGQKESLGEEEGIDAYLDSISQILVENSKGRILELYSHQKEGVKSLLQYKKYGIFDEMGVAKTIQLLLVCHFLEKPVLVVCPKSIISVWQKEGKILGMDFQVFTGKNGNHPYLILNYDNLKKYEKPLKEIVQGRLLIADESHKIKNRKAQRTKAFCAIAHQAERLYLASGTPGANRPEDIWQQGTLIDPVLFGSYRNFVKRFCKLGNKFSKWAITGYRNLSELASIVSQVSIRRLKKDCLSLPEKLYNTLYCAMGREQRRMYQELKRELSTVVEEEEISITNNLTLLLRLLQITSNPRSLDPGYTGQNPKIEALLDFLEDIEEERIVIFSVFRDTIDLLYEILAGDQFNYTVWVYDGRTSLAERELIVDEFSKVYDTPTPRIILANTATGGEGINLQAGSLAIFFDRNFNLTQYQQSQDRFHRIGQENTVNIVNIIAENSIDEAIHTALEGKLQLQRITMNDI